jgi:hypothetical protein
VHNRVISPKFFNGLIPAIEVRAIMDSMITNGRKITVVLQKGSVAFLESLET